MNSTIPNYHERRLTLTDIEQQIRENIGGPDVIDIGQTIRAMLPDLFYGEQVAIAGQHFYTEQDRTIVFPVGKDATLDGIELMNAIELLGDIFWALLENVTMRMLRVTETYTLRPSDCFYKFYPETLELVVYTPVMQGVQYALNLTALDGRAVVATCNDTLPSHLRVQNSLA